MGGGAVVEGLGEVDGSHLFIEFIFLIIFVRYGLSWRVGERVIRYIISVRILQPFISGITKMSR